MGSPGGWRPAAKPWEAGLLLAVSGVEAAVLERLRDRVRADESAFADLLLAERIVLDARAIEEVARFITPVGAPRRFDARFFVAESPHDPALTP